MQDTATNGILSTIQVVKNSRVWVAYSTGRSVMMISKTPPPMASCPPAIQAVRNSRVWVDYSTSTRSKSMAGMVWILPMQCRRAALPAERPDKTQPLRYGAGDMDRDMDMDRDRDRDRDGDRDGDRDRDCG